MLCWITMKSCAFFRFLNLKQWQEYRFRHKNKIHCLKFEVFSSLVWVVLSIALKTPLVKLKISTIDCHIFLLILVVGIGIFMLIKQQVIA